MPAVLVIIIDELLLLVLLIFVVSVTIWASGVETFICIVWTPLITHYC